jgi:hypothetical protein
MTGKHESHTIGALRKRIISIEPIRRTAFMLFLLSLRTPTFRVHLDFQSVSLLFLQNFVGRGG